MHAYSNYVIAFKGSKSAKAKATRVLSEKIGDDEALELDVVQVEENYEVVWFEDLVEMATEMAKAAPSVKFAMRGYVDCTESCGEFVPFAITYADKNLIARGTSWICDYDRLDQLDDEILCEISDDDITNGFFEDLLEAIDGDKYDDIECIEI